MPDLDRYFFREVLRPFLGFTAALSAIVWLTQSLQMLDLIINRGQSLGTFLLVTAFVFPSLLAVVLPFALFCAVIYALNRMASDSEITVFWASGIGNLRMARPILVIALGAVIATLIINLYLMPAGYRAMKDMVYEIRTDLATSFIREGEFSHPSKGITLSTLRMKSTGEVKSFFLHDTRDPERVITYDAQHGRVVRSATGPKLILVNGTIQTAEAGGKISLLGFDKHTLDLTEFVQANGPKLRELTERYLHELLNPDLEKRWEKANVGRLHAEGHNRLASPLYNFAFVLIALAAFFAGPQSRRGRGLRITIALGAGLLVRISGFGLQSLAAQHAAFQALQYLLPIAVSLVCLLLLSDAPRRIRQAIEQARRKYEDRQMTASPG